SAMDYCARTCAATGPRRAMRRHSPYAAGSRCIPVAPRILSRARKSGPDALSRHAGLAGRAAVYGRTFGHARQRRARLGVAHGVEEVERPRILLQREAYVTAQRALHLRCQFVGDAQPRGRLEVAALQE